MLSTPLTPKHSLTDSVIWIYSVLENWYVVKHRYVVKIIPGDIMFWSTNRNYSWRPHFILPLLQRVNAHNRGQFERYSNTIQHRKSDITQEAYKSWISINQYDMQTPILFHYNIRHPPSMTLDGYIDSWNHDTVKIHSYFRFTWGSRSIRYLSSSLVSRLAR